RSGSSLQYPNHLQPVTPTGHRGRIRLNTIDKMATSHVQRFLLLQIWDVAVSVMIRVLKLSECVVVRRSLDPDIIDPDFLMGLQIVVHDHAARTNDGHFADFSWFKPTTLHGSKSLVREEQRHIGHVLYLGRNVRVSLT